MKMQAPIRGVLLIAVLVPFLFACSAAKQEAPWQTVQAGEYTGGSDMLEALDTGGYRVSGWSRAIMSAPDFPVSTDERDVPLYLVEPEELGLAVAYPMANIVKAAGDLGYAKAPRDTAPLLRMMWHDQPNDHSAVVISDPLSHPDDDHEYVLSAERALNGDEWIVAYKYTAGLEDIFSNVDTFVFTKPADTSDEAETNDPVTAQTLSAVSGLVFPGDSSVTTSFGSTNGAVPVTLGRDGVFLFSSGITGKFITLSAADDENQFPILPFLNVQKNGDTAVGLLAEQDDLFLVAAFGTRKAFFGISGGYYKRVSAFDANAGHRNLFVRFSQQRADGAGILTEAGGTAVGFTAQKTFQLRSALFVTPTLTADRFLGGSAVTEIGSAHISPSDWDLTAMLNIAVAL